MKKLFLAAALTAACSLSAIADDNDAKYKWSTDNCKDAGVTTSVNNRYNTSGNDAQVTVSGRPQNVETYTRIENEYGDIQEKYESGAYKNSEHNYESYYEVKDATTECRWKK